MVVEEENDCEAGQGLLPSRMEYLKELLERKSNLEGSLSAFIEAGQVRAECNYHQTILARRQLLRKNLEHLVLSRLECNQRLKWQNYLKSKHLLSCSGEIVNIHNSLSKLLVASTAKLHKIMAGIQSDQIKLQRELVQSLFSIYPMDLQHGTGALTIANRVIPQLPKEDKQKDGSGQRSLQEYAASTSCALFLVGAISILFGVPVFHENAFLGNKGGFCIPGFASSLSLAWMSTHITKHSFPRDFVIECYPLYHPRLSRHHVASSMHIHKRNTYRLVRRVFVHKESHLSEGFTILERSMFCILRTLMNRYGIECEDNLDPSIGSALIILHNNFLNTFPE